MWHKYEQECMILGKSSSCNPEPNHFSWGRVNLDIVFNSGRKNPISVTQSCLLACLFFSSLFCFALLKLQVFSRSFALTGEDQPESSLLATMWDWRGEVAARSAAAEIFYTYAITHPARAEFTPCLYPLPANTLRRRVGPTQGNNKKTSTFFFLWLMLTLLSCQQKNDEWHSYRSVFFSIQACKYNKTTILSPTSRFLMNVLREAEHYWLPLQTLKTVKRRSERLSGNHICNYDNVNWACQGWIISRETVKHT